MKIIDEPWRHMILDNVFDPELIDSTIKEFKGLFNEHDYRDTNERFRILLRDVEMRKRTKKEVKHFLELCNSFDAKCLLEHFPNRRRKGITRIEGELMYCGSNYNYPIHDENKSKVLSCVTYLEPETNSGTLIFDENKNYHSEIEWKQNRMMVFAGETGKTWHSYNADGKNPRITFNIFLM